MQGSFVQKGASVQLRPASKVSAVRNVAPKKTVKTTVVAQAVAEAEYAVRTGTAARKVLRIGKANHEPPSTLCTRRRDFLCQLARLYFSACTKALLVCLQVENPPGTPIVPPQVYTTAP